MNTSNNYNTPAVMGLGYEPGGIHNPKNKRPGFSAGDRTNGSELNDWSENPSQPSPPSTQQPTSPDPQEFADQKKEEVKKTYSTSHGDRINNAYRDHYGRNAHADEIANWTGTGMGIEDIQKGLKTSFARDGEHLVGDQLANLQIPQEPQQPQQPDSSPNTPQPVQPPQLTDEDHMEAIKKRFAGSDAFTASLGNLQQSPLPQNNNNNNNDSQTDSNSNDSNTEPTRLDEQRNEFQQQIDSNNAAREANGQISGPDRLKQSILLAEDRAAGSNFNPMQLANQYINNAERNNPINGEALNQQIYDDIQYFGDRATLEGLKNWGDVAKDRADNPLVWAPRNPPSQPQRPDFQSIYDEQIKQIKKFS